MNDSSLEKAVEIVFNVSKYILISMYAVIVSYSACCFVFLLVGLESFVIVFPSLPPAESLVLLLVFAHIPIPLALAAVVDCQTLNMMSTHAYRTGQVADALWDQILNKEPERGAFE